MKDVELITVEEACVIACRPSAVAFHAWVRRHNKKASTDCLIMTCYGRVDKNSLLRAINNQLKKHTPGAARAARRAERYLRIADGSFSQRRRGN